MNEIDSSQLSDTIVLRLIKLLFCRNRLLESSAIPPPLLPRCVRVLLRLYVVFTRFCAKIQLRDGRILQGRMLNITGIGKKPSPARPDDSDNQATPILLVDDDLRRTYVPKYFFINVLDEAREQQIKIPLWQNTSNAGTGISSVGPSLGITPFDEYGRRIYRMQTKDGPLSVVQAITELTPRYAKIETWRGQPRWDMRLATSSIPETHSSVS